MKIKNIKIYLGLFVVGLGIIFGFLIYTIIDSNSYTIVRADKTNLDEGNVSLYFEAKGNDIYYVEQEVITYIDSDNTDSLKKIADNTEKNYSKYSGIKYSYKIENNKYIENIKFEINKADNESMRILGLTNKDNVEVELKLDKTLNLLKKDNYTVTQKRK